MVGHRQPRAKHFMCNIRSATFALSPTIQYTRCAPATLCHSGFRRRRFQFRRKAPIDLRRYSWCGNCSLFRCRCGHPSQCVIRSLPSLYE